MLNGVGAKIRLTPSKSNLHLMAHGAAAGCKSVITHASLFVRKVKLNPAVALAHEKTLEKGTAKYPIKESSAADLWHSCGKFRSCQRQFVPQSNSHQTCH